MSQCPLHPEESLSRIGCVSVAQSANFAKSAQFSPDGGLLLCATENNTACISSLSEAAIDRARYYGQNTYCSDSAPNIEHLTQTKSVPIGESIYDLKWYPSAAQGTTPCFVSTSRDHPIMLWDVGDQHTEAAVRCTYRGYDHNDEIAAAVSLGFNLTGDKLYAGYNRMIRCFDVSCPGRDFSEIPTSATKKSAYGQKGLISTIAFNPDYSGAYAAGSFAQSVGVYVENSTECALLLSDIGFGVTHVRWSPCGRYLWVGGRSSSVIQCWDIRATQSIVGSVRRDLSTNQRMTFDIDPWGKYLCTGDKHGKILFYDTTTYELVSSVEAVGAKGMCVNSVAYHPYSALLGVAAGERVFQVEADDSDSDDSDDAGDLPGHVDEHASCQADSTPEESAGQVQKKRKVELERQLDGESSVHTIPGNSVERSGKLEGSASSSSIGSGRGSSVQLWRIAFTPQALPQQPDTELVSSAGEATEVMEVAAGAEPTSAATEEMEEGQCPAE